MVVAQVTGGAIEPIVAKASVASPGDRAESGSERDRATELTDRERQVVSAVLGGDVDRFRDLVEPYQGRLIATLARLVGSRHQAEELAQQSFIDAFKALKNFDSRRRFSTWLFRIAVNNAKDWLKSKKRGEQSLDASVHGESAAFAGHLEGPEAAAIAKQRSQKLLAAIDRLPQQYREVLVLKDIQQLSYAETQEILGYPITTLKIRAVRGRAALREALEPDGE